MNHRFRPFLAALALLAAANADAGRLPVGLPDAELAAKELRTNPNRAYPPSCLSTPLPTASRGEAVTRVVPIGGLDNSSFTFYSENVNVTVWREACSNGKSAVLVRLDRPSTPANKFPQVPEPYLTINGQAIRVRMHQDANTRFADDVGLAIANDSTFVLENYGTPNINFDNALVLSLVTAASSTQQFVHTFNLPAYNAATHPDGARQLEINGYVTGSYFDPSRAGEGAVVEVGERTDGRRFIGFYWYTYDPAGNPIFLVGNVDVANDARTVTIPLLYIKGGGFAGNFNPATVNAQTWGNVRLEFPRCNAMRMIYTSTASLPGAPTGEGTVIWDRGVSINGLACE